MSIVARFLSPFKSCQIASRGFSCLKLNTTFRINSRLYCTAFLPEFTRLSSALHSSRMNFRNNCESLVEYINRAHTLDKLHWISISFLVRDHHSSIGFSQHKLQILIDNRWNYAARTVSQPARLQFSCLFSANSNVIRTWDLCGRNFELLYVYQAVVRIMRETAVCIFHSHPYNYQLEIDYLTPVVGNNDVIYRILL